MFPEEWDMAASCRIVSNHTRAEQEANVGAEKLRLAKILQVGVLLKPVLVVHYMPSSY